MAYDDADHDVLVVWNTSMLISLRLEVKFGPGLARIGGCQQLSYLGLLFNIWQEHRG